MVGKKEEKLVFLDSRKNKSKARFQLTGIIRFHPELKLIQLPRLDKLRLEERPAIPVNGWILNVTVSRTADRWYVSATVEETQPDPQPIQGEIGKT